MVGPTPDSVILLEESEVRIPLAMEGLGGFRAWTLSPGFPERGRIDWIEGCVEVDMSPEELNTHATVKVALSGDLRALVEGSDRGVVLSDRFRIASEEASLSAEPDVVVCLFASIEARRARLIPRPGATAGYVEIEGAPDVVVEVLSDSSARKDRERLREAYFRAGIPEYWIVDARRDPPLLELLRRGAGGYEPAAAESDGSLRSLVLERAFQLVRLPPKLGIVRYRLDSRPV